MRSNITLTEKSRLKRIPANAAGCGALNRRNCVCRFAFSHRQLFTPVVTRWWAYYFSSSSQNPFSQLDIPSHPRALTERTGFPSPCLQSHRRHKMEKAYCSRAVTSVGRNCRPCSAQDTGFHRRHVLGQFSACRLLGQFDAAPALHRWVPHRHGCRARWLHLCIASSRRLLGVDVRQCLLAQPVDPLYRHPVVSLVRKRATGGPRVPPLFGRGLRWSSAFDYSSRVRVCGTTSYVGSYARTRSPRTQPKRWH